MRISDWSSDVCSSDLTYVVLGVRDGACDRRIAFQRLGAGEHSSGKSACLQQSQDAPHSHSAAIFKHRLRGKVPTGKAFSADSSTADFTDAVPVIERGFRAFFVVDDEIPDRKTVE